MSLESLKSEDLHRRVQRSLKEYIVASGMKSGDSIPTEMELSERLGISRTAIREGLKGLEALVCECVLAGRKAGVIETVLDSLDDTYPGFDWKKRSAYMLERVMTHGLRRAAEMREVALTVELLGLDNAMSKATVGWQQAVGDLRLCAEKDEMGDYRLLADRILAHLDKRPRT